MDNANPAYCATFYLLFACHASLPGYSAPLRIISVGALLTEGKWGIGMG